MSNSSFSQKSDSTSVVIKKEKKHSPKTAALLSIVPGLGQVYNEAASPKKHSSWWKIPIIYAGIGAATYFAIDNYKKYQQYVNDYQVRTDSTNNGDLNFINIENPDQLQTLAEQHQTYLEWAVVGGVIVYLLNILDASIDGHFVSFNVSDDLSLNINPYSNYVNNNYTIGLSLRLNLH